MSLQSNAVSGWIGAAVALALAACCAGGEPTAAPAGPPVVTLVEDGRPVATIVVSADAGKLVQDAAVDLQLHIEKMSGGRLPIADAADTPGNLIFVGRSPAVEKLIPDLDGYDLGNDGVVIKTWPGKLVLTGKSGGYYGSFGRTDCGTPNAVYYFLESLGCRWYLPGDDGLVIPQRPTVAVGAMNVVSKPDFACRGVRVNAAYWMAKGDDDNELYQECLTWQARNRVSMNGHHEGHSMRGLLPRRLFPSHPEYFALVAGKRRGDHAAQVCMSHPEVRKIVTRNFRSLLARGTPARAYPVGHYDSWLWCECDGCDVLYGEKTFTYSNRDEARAVGISPDKTYRNTAQANVQFVNAIAEKVAQSHPDMLVTFYALYHTPGVPEVAPRDNVMPVMAHIRPREEYWRREVMRWEAMSKRLWYHGYMGHRIALPKLDIAQDIRWCRQHKGVALSLDMNEYSPINSLPMYLATKVLWDTRVDAQQLLREFYASFYGQAKAPMREFWETFDAATREAARRDDTMSFYPDSFTTDTAARCRGHLTEALRKAQRPVVRRRIESLLRYWRAVELHVASQVASAAWRENKTDANARAAATALRATKKAVEALLGEFYLGHRLGPLNASLKEFHRVPVAAAGQTLLELPEMWVFREDPERVGREQRWFDTSVDMKNFRPISTHAGWEGQIGRAYDGYAWYLMDATIPETTAGHVWLLFGAVDEAWQVWIDGQYVGASPPNPDEIRGEPTAVEITGRYRPGKKTRIAIRVHNYDAGGGIWKPVKITTTEKGQQEGYGGEDPLLPGT